MPGRTNLRAMDIQGGVLLYYDPVHRLAEHFTDHL